jgi:hypothetical protein
MRPRTLFNLALPGFLPGFARADETQQNPLQLLQPQQATGQNLQAGNAPPALHDIYGPIDLPGPVPYLLYGLIALAVILAFLALYWWLYKRPKPAVSPIPPAMIARDELMRARELMKPEQALRYMERISEILRRYLESRFHLPTTRQTTREFFRSLGHKLPEHLSSTSFKAELKDCLDQCDLAKFAHQPAALEHLQQMENSVLGLINQTDEQSSDVSKRGTS